MGSSASPGLRLHICAVGVICPHLLSPVTIHRFTKVRHVKGECGEGARWVLLSDRQ